MHGCARTTSNLYVLMEFCSEGDLKMIIKSNSLTEAKAK
jgi:hypothetical protein